MPLVDDSQVPSVRVLVVEDGTVSAQALLFQLQRLGHEVVGIFPSGEEAVGSVCSLRPDVVLIDIGLAGQIDGVETAEQISVIYDVPVVYLTSTSDDATFQRAKITNPFAWLSKPTTSDDLHRAICMALYKQELYGKLKTSEEKYRGIVENMSEGLVILDADLCIAFANARFLSMVREFDVTGAKGEPFASFLCDGTLADFSAGREALSDLGRLVIQGSIIAKDGASIPAGFSMSRWGDVSCPKGCSLASRFGYVCVVNDLTEQVAAASALREAESKYRTLFENALDGIFQSLPDGRFREVNSAMAAIFGYDSPLSMVREISNAAVDLYASPEDRLVFLEALKLKEQVSRFQVRMKKRCGSKIWVEISARAVRAKDGTIQLIEGILFDITDRKVTELDLRRRASRDDLTGLYNRVFFREWLNGAMSSAERNGSHLGMLYIDLNSFKSVNDTYGHNVGDMVLRELASRICETVRECDMVARIGGDEFCVVLQGVSTVDDVCRVSQKISETLMKPLTVDSMILQLGGSVGIAIYPEDGTDVDTLLHRADEAMYRVKQNGTRGYTFWNELSWENAI